ncbi:peptidoglycan/xylan/chitin deacetylase (PgdA/CDA1 family) [Clostridium beijerinckii]|nr:peptidoglycan/xylan/chitin deacetylase (PgdA/CDA1 family) [Clostridium beijerinckii]NSA91074.1 peptidoglycan/xylan/chitin deacetylase (PgdA/CDA1 family) [Clostridium beijerinckii]
MLKQEVEEGHSIGNHSYSHNYKYLYPNGSVNTNNFMSEINKTNESLKKVLGEDFSTRAIRFPGGHMSWKNTGEVDKIMKEKDYYYVDWNALSKDAEGPLKNADQLTEEVKKTVGNKTKVVLLMHDTYGKEETAKALPGIIEYLKSQGYEFRTFK